MKDICLVVPTIRENCMLDFIARWKEKGLFDHVDLMVMEDNPTRTWTNLDVKHHFCWESIELELKENSWIIPRRSDTVRSFAYWKAWSLKYKYIMTMDDDCYPTAEEDGLLYSGKGFIDEHLKALNGNSSWFNTLTSVKPRGIPFYNTGKLKNVVINHGLWTNVIDYDAPFQLANPIEEKFSYDNRVVPQNQYFPMCGMNLMWHADYTVLLYHLLMGQTIKGTDKLGRVGPESLEKLQFDRFGDIWCGIFMKRILDAKGLNVTTGMPYIRHERASNPFTNLKKEANGIEVNEALWEYVDNITLSQQDNVEQMYVDLAKQISRFDKYPEFTNYFVRLGYAMERWAQLFGASYE